MCRNQWCQSEAISRRSTFTRGGSSTAATETLPKVLSTLKDGIVPRASVEASQLILRTNKAT